MRRKLNNQQAGLCCERRGSTPKFLELYAITAPPYLDYRCEAIAVCKLKGGGTS